MLYLAKRYQHGRPNATWKKALEICSKPNAKRIMMNTLSLNLQNYWQCMGHLDIHVGYVVSRQKKEKTIEWTALKLVKGGLWVLFDVQIAFHHRKSNIFKFFFFHLLLIFEIKCQTIHCWYVKTSEWYMLGSGFNKMSQASLHSEGSVSILQL